MHEEFIKEFNKRVENRYLHHINEVRSKTTDLRKFRAIPTEVLMETFKAGVNCGVKVMAEMIKEGK